MPAINWLKRYYRLSLASGLVLWHAFTTIGIALAAGFLIYWGLSRELRHATDNLLLERIHLLRALIAEGTRASDVLRWEVESEWEWLEHYQIFLRILDVNERVVVETSRFAQVLPAAAFPAPVSLRGQLRSIRASGQSGGVYQMMAAEAVGPGGDELYVIQAAFALASEEEMLRSFGLLLGFVVALSILASVGLGYGITKRGLQPLAEIVETTRRIRGSTLAERVSSRGLPPELVTLADNINAMLERLEDSFTRLSRFSADVAHELRTPLNNLRGEAEVALAKTRTPEEYREVLASILDECASLTKTIERLLFIAQAERAEIRLQREKIDLPKHLGGVAEFYEPILSEKGLDFRLLCKDASLWLEADAELLRRAVGNLVANAVAYTPAGGTVAVDAIENNGTVRVQVRDTGIGIAPEHLPHVLDRFYRVEQTRTKAPGGAGLGLSIVKAVADLHGGTVEIASELGSGTCVTLVLPKIKS